MRENLPLAIMRVALSPGSPRALERLGSMITVCVIGTLDLAYGSNMMSY